MEEDSGCKETNEWWFIAIDGCFFGTSLPLEFLIHYPSYVDPEPLKVYEPKLYGFSLSKESPAYRKGRFTEMVWIWEWLWCSLESRFVRISVFFNLLCCSSVYCIVCWTSKLCSPLCICKIVFQCFSMAPKGSTRYCYNFIFTSRKRSTAKGHDFSEAYDWNTVAKWLSATIQRQICSSEITQEVYKYSFLQQICLTSISLSYVDSDLKSFWAFQEHHGVDALLNISNFIPFYWSFTVTLFHIYLSHLVSVVFYLEIRMTSFFEIWTSKMNMAMSY